MGKKNKTKLTRDSLLRTTLVALMSVPELAETLVFKGGNAIEWFHDGSGRASTDLDFSMEKPVAALDLVHLRSTALETFAKAFAPHDLHVVDLTVEIAPPGLTPDFAPFWGGATISFRLASSETVASFGRDNNELRRRSVLIDGMSKFQVDISCHEYCGTAEQHAFHGCQIYVYSLPLIVAEKVRALCQQTAAYRQLVRGKARGRAQDLYDIHALVRRLNIDVTSIGFLNLLRQVFNAKRCPRETLLELASCREMHLADYEERVHETLTADSERWTFDDYFAYVCDLAAKLHSAWIE